MAVSLDLAAHGPHDDRIYGIPVQAAVLVDVPLAVELHRAVQAHTAAYFRYRQTLTGNTFVDSDDVRDWHEHYMRNSIDQLTQACKQVVPSCLKALRHPSVWTVAGLVDGVWQHVRESAWNHLAPPTPLHWIRGHLTLAGVEHFGMRVRPLLPLPFDQAVVAFGTPALVGAFFDARSRRDAKLAARICRHLSEDLLLQIYFGVYRASFLAAPNVRADIDRETLDRGNVSFTGADIVLGGRKLCAVEVWLPDPFPTPMPVTLTNWLEGGSSAPAPAPQLTPAQRHAITVAILTELAQASPERPTHNSEDCRALCPIQTDKEYVAARNKAFAPYPAWQKAGRRPER